MAEIVKKKVQAVKVTAKCDCGGEFILTGNVIPTCPPYYTHKCDKCGKTEDYHNKYPNIYFEEVD